MDEVYQFLQNEIKNNTVIVVGVSGGPDSMAILHLLLKLRDIKKLNIICAHVNHNIRKESEEEASHLEQYCKEYNITFEMMMIEEYNGANFESEAREKRYAFFEKLITKYNAAYLMTAHHGDDLIETILMRIVRGSTFKGYAGFSKVIDKCSYKIERPLISVTKDDILKYYALHNIKYDVDSSNTTDEHTRNRYRKYVLPFLKKEDSNVHEKFLKFSQTILEYNEYINKEMLKVIDDIYVNGNLNIVAFLKTDKVIQDRIINHIMETIYHDDLNLINNMHTSLIMKLITSSKPNSYVYLPNNIRIIKAYDMLSFINSDNEIDDYEIELSPFVNLPNGHNIELIEDNNDQSNFVCRLNSSEVALPLYIRNKREGDRIQIKGLHGHKKIKDIFINEKISMNERDKWPVLVDKNGNIIWLPGLKKSIYDKSKKERYDIIIKYC
jgi:tRNA(Ile)-lysidine synthase